MPYASKEERREYNRKYYQREQREKKCFYCPQMLVVQMKKKYISFFDPVCHNCLPKAEAEQRMKDGG